jgi:ubiquinone/menaquinone biosynthesis C-methylase UbiE
LPSSNKPIYTLLPLELPFSSSCYNGWVAAVNVVFRMTNDIIHYFIMLGPGTWLFDMAEDFPHCHFYGIDVAPVFPQGIKPSNVTFALANLTEPLPYPDHHFDYIHQRLLLFGLTLPQWDVAMQELLRVLKPGGWIEFVEVSSLSGQPEKKKLQFLTTALYIRSIKKRIIEALC